VPISRSLILQERRVFAHNLKEARRQAKITQDELAKITGMTQAFISKIENSESSVSLVNAKHLADALQLPLCKLLNPIEPVEK
jgi:transcriptional regulator with XRE-family HTH domain